MQLVTMFVDAQPVDPTEYQNEWLGDVINICTCSFFPCVAIEFESDR
jgi:hypothetical protein